MIKKNFIIFSFLILSIGLISAIPGIPHQFYGNVEVNGQPASNNILSASINEEEYSTIINNGVYGIRPNTFFVEDPEGSNNRDKITFYIGGKQAGTYIFESNKLTKLDFSLTTTCGDGYCLGDETCSTCSNDCGVCVESSEIKIISPENKIYNTSKIDLNVYSNQDILIWMYSINSETPQVFIPNITLTLYDGNYELKITGINKAYQTNSKTVLFSVDMLYDYCGDGKCKGAETCSNCPGDCGTCSSGGGGGGVVRQKNTNNENITINSTNENVSIQTNEIDNSEENINNQDGTEFTQQDKDNKNFFSRITGAVISAGQVAAVFKILVVIMIVFVLILIIILLKKRKNIKSVEIQEISI